MNYCLNSINRRPKSARLRSTAQRPLSSGLVDTIRSGWKGIRLSKIFLFIVSILLFTLAITLMKEGTSDLAPLLQSVFAVASPVNSLGFGWLFAYLILSGSPVAAAALSFFDAGVIDQLDAFTMIIGSRLGASFMVLFVGFVYMLRGRGGSDGLSMGLLSLSVTGTTYLFALAIGIVLFQTGILDRIQLQSGPLLTSAIDQIFSPIINLARNLLPVWGLAVLGLGLIMVSFNLFDRCLPQMAVKESQVGQVSRLVYRPWVMFALGAAITSISMSVSISLSILVPLSNRGFIRRENVIPYIMGTNITTFIDTLLAALLLNNPACFTIVLVAVVSITLVSVFILTSCYHRYERAMLVFVSWSSAKNSHLIFFMTVILLVPIILLLW